MNKHHTLNEQHDEILLLIDYATPENDLTLAKKMVETYRADRIGLNLLQEFYSYLPEAENDFIKRIQLLDSREGVFLLLITTNIERYLYMTSLDSAVFLGKHSEGIWDKDALEYFHLSRDEAGKRFKETDIFPEYTSLDQSTTYCKICSAAVGETHRFGCPVEICPWCSGQLSTCNCRFNELNKEKLDSNKDLQIFNNKLTKKGRIPFDLSQQPGGLLE